MDEMLCVSVESDFVRSVSIPVVSSWAERRRVSLSRVMLGDGYGS